MKDYVNGKLLYCRSPPGIPEDSFNQATHEQALLRMAGKKRAPVTRVGKDADTFVPTNATEKDSGTPQGHGPKSQALDYDFFENNARLSSRPFIQSSLHHGEEFTRPVMYPHQNTVADDGSLLNKRNITGVSSRVGKKSNFKIKRTKQRSGKGYD